jgi:hypothetical protein
MTPAQKAYQESYEKYKDVVIGLGLYESKTQGHVKMEIISIEGDSVSLKDIRTGNVKVKTLHWCRKSLVKSEKNIGIGDESTN